MLRTINNNSYKFRPAGVNDVHWIARLEERLYGPDAVPYDLLRVWFEANPGGFILVVDGGGHRVGNVNLLPLRAQGVTRLLKSGASERALRARDLHAPAERDEVRSVYVESLAADAPDAYTRGLVLAAIVCGLGTFSARVAELGSLEDLYAVAATPQGERVVRRFGFRATIGSAARGDGKPLFHAAARPTFERIDLFCRGLRR